MSKIVRIHVPPGEANIWREIERRRRQDATNQVVEFYARGLSRFAKGIVWAIGIELGLAAVGIAAWEIWRHW